MQVALALLSCGAVLVVMQEIQDLGPARSMIVLLGAELVAEEKPPKKADARHVQKRAPRDSPTRGDPRDLPHPPSPPLLEVPAPTWSPPLVQPGAAAHRRTSPVAGRRRPAQAEAMPQQAQTVVLQEEPLALPAETPPSPVGVLHFLFLSDAGLPHAHVWADFLSQAPSGSYTLWLHCRNHQACVDSDVTQVLPGIVLVPTVPSLWCYDLLSPTVQLIQAAWNCGSSDVPEKYVLLSHTTLPLKPFPVMHARLFSTPRSDFCMAGARGWRNVEWSDLSVTIAKHHQWFVLNRRDAQKLVKGWVPGSVYALPGPLDVQLLIDGGFCADESVAFSLIYGLLNFEEARAQALNQTCHTWFAWRGGHTLLARIETDRKSSVIRSNGIHPASIQKLSRASMLLFRDSRYLFARKFDPSVNFNGFSEVVFGVTPTRRKLTGVVATKKACTQEGQLLPGFRMHFLFLLDMQMSQAHQELWSKFFEQGPAGGWTAWAMCHHEGPPCRSGLNATRRSTMPWQWVPALPEDAARDRLTALVHILRFAIKGEGFGAEEKFILVNDLSVPLKPFALVYDALQAAAGEVSVSDICIRDSRHWRTVNGLFSMVKHSQWVALSRDDARKLVLVWQRPFRTKKDWLVYYWSGSGKNLKRMPKVPVIKKGVAPLESSLFTVLYGLYPQGQKWVRILARKWPQKASMTAEMSRNDILTGSRCLTLDFDDDHPDAAARLKRELAEVPENRQPTPINNASLENFPIFDVGALQKLRASSFLFATPVDAVDVQKYASVLLA